MTDPRGCKDSNRADRQPQQIAPTGAQQRLLYRAAWGAHRRAGLCVYHLGLLGSSNLTSSEPIQPRGKPSMGRVTDLSRAISLPYPAISAVKLAASLSSG